MKKKIIKSFLRNVNCSFKKLKKNINFIKQHNINSIFFFLNQNNCKSFFFLNKIFKNCINNALNLGIKFEDLKIHSIYITKGKILKKISPRAKGKCDFVKRISNNITLFLSHG
ncbi:large ribosomal subunit protein uL22 [Candidatus Vidania fulgoroideorum]